MATGSPPSWHELNHILASLPPAPPPYLGALPPPPPSLSAISFDSSADLLFTGNAAGGVQSWYGQGLARYTAWKAAVAPTVPANASSSHQSGGSQEVQSPTIASASDRKLQVSWKKSQGALQPPPQIQGAAPPGTVAGGNGIRELWNDGGNVYSVSPHGVHCASRRGLARWSKDVSAMGHPSLSLSSICPSPVHSSSDVIVCGYAPAAEDQQIVAVNRHVGTVVRKVAAEGTLLQVRKSQRYLLSSTPGGHIQLRDPRSLELEHKLHAHPGGVIDMKCEGSLVWSVGWTMRLGHPVPEPLIKVHDVRNMRALVPIPFAAPGGPALLDIHPRMGSTVIVAAPQGAWQIVDMNSPGEAGFFQLNTSSMITSLSLSPSAEYIAFGEADGTVRLWSTSEAAAALNHPDTVANAPRFTNFSTSPPDLPDPPERLPTIDWSQDVPLSSVGMPYYDQPLCSNLPFETFVSPSSPLFNPSPKIDGSVLGSLRQVDGIHFAPLPRHLRGRRNVVRVTGRGFPPGPGRSGVGGPREAGKVLFRSEKEKERIKKSKAGSLTGDESRDATESGSTETEDDGEESGSEGLSLPNYWRKKTIVYSKFGVEDFDFGMYNKTRQSGLETHIPNCYLNSLLQCLFHLPTLRSLAEIHTLAGGPGRCEREDCLLCEAGFLFKMLSDAAGVNCQATNFLRAFAKSRKAISLGLLDDEDTTDKVDVPYANLIQSANRLLVDSLASSWAEMAVLTWANEAQQGGQARKSLVEDLFASTTRVRTTCLNCRHELVRDSKALVVDLIYPRKPLSNEPSAPTNFASVLSASLARESYTKSPCRACGSSNASILSRRTLPKTQDLPQTISIGANVLTADQMALWIDGAVAADGRRRKGAAPQAPTQSKQRYLPSRISIESGGKEGDKAVIKELRQEDEAPPAGAAVYRLKSMVMQIQAPKDPAHLVSVVRVPNEGGDSKDAATWHLFNDFLVRTITEDEALSFPAATWKIPAVIYFERVDRQTVDVASIPWTLDSAILTEDVYISKKRDPKQIRHRPFSPDEMPGKGDLLSIDAEFVSLNPEEMEISSSGARSVVRPTTMSLARVSVLRGQGAHEGEPCIDDHIATSDRVFDYLTQFSGIVDGDLDPERSKHTVLPQKLAYKKLRLLVDLGCIFIGHGLKKDFRIINIHVGAKQVIDTVDLFSSTSQARKLSLRFLSWFLLKEAIQGDKLSSGASGNGSGSTAASLVRGDEEEAVTGHDSIEDARAALHLYRIYETFMASGRLEDVMEDLYEEGKRLNWRPPPSTAVSAGAVGNVAAAAAAAVVTGEPSSV
ncbi:unnamed protein product [Parajaminaea phylloscopi]